MYVLSVFADLIFADFADETLSNRLFLYFKRLFLQISVLFEINQFSRELIFADFADDALLVGFRGN